MCSICGGTQWDEIAQHIWEESRDRGRDDSGLCFSDSGSWIGNHRATPTTEIESPIERQPVGKDGSWKFVFNGIIANDSQLGILPNEADTSVLPRIIQPNPTKIDMLWKGVQKIKGSFAIATMHPSDGEIQLACNYKPIWILERRGEFYFSSLKHHLPSFPSYRMPPYSVQMLQDFDSNKSLHRYQSSKVLVICSSGLDSTAVASYCCQLHGPKKVTLLHFDYGCLAGAREKTSIIKIAEYLNCGLEIIPMTSFGGSSLLEKESDIVSGISGAEYAHEWVPARNLIMLSLAVGYAEANSFGHIYLGTNLEEAGAYPDNEEQFILDFNALLYGAVQNGLLIEIHTPLGGLMKHEIVPWGIKYKAPFHLTWSCYRGGEKHCGDCGPCFMRKTAFSRNDMDDPVFKRESNG